MKQKEWVEKKAFHRKLLHYFFVFYIRSSLGRILIMFRCFFFFHFLYVLVVCKASIFHKKCAWPSSTIAICIHVWLFYLKFSNKPSLRLVWILMMIWLLFTMRGEFALLKKQIRFLNEKNRKKKQKNYYLKTNFV